MWWSCCNILIQLPEGTSSRTNSVNKRHARIAGFFLTDAPDPCRPLPSQRRIGRRRRRLPLTCATFDLRPLPLAAAIDEKLLLPSFQLRVQRVKRSHRTCLRLPRAETSHCCWPAARLSVRALELYRWRVFTHKHASYAKWWIVHKIKSHQWNTTCPEYRRTDMYVCMYI